MKFSELVDQAREFLRRRARVSYRALKREFDLDDESLEDLKVELIDAQRIATDEDGKVLVWGGVSSVPSSEFQVPSSSQPPAPSPQPLSRVGFSQRQLAQLGATLGREFSYELLHAVAPTSEADLQAALIGPLSHLFIEEEQSCNVSMTQ